MKLFVIGNGFDLAHGLKTSYSDFRDYIEEKNWNFLSSLEAMYGIVLGDWVDRMGEELWKERVKEYLWKDFETNLSNIDETIIYSGEDIDLGLESGDIGVEDTLDEYWEEQYSFIEDLNEYIMHWINQVDIHIDKITDIINSETNDKFLTFNYTLLLEEVYDIDKCNILHIHGSVDENDLSPVIGHGNKEKIDKMLEVALEAEEEYLEKRCSIYNAVAKYYKRALKDVPHFLYYNKKFFENLSSINEIFIIGHSLGEVDMPYFKAIKNNVNDDVIWNVYYYRECDRLTYMEKIISIGVKEENIVMLHTSSFFY